MCRRIQCSSCGKPTYAGCGMHVEQVLGDVPKEDRCRCREESRKGRPEGSERPSLLRRLFGF
jgi:hypothetical protein